MTPAAKTAAAILSAVIGFTGVALLAVSLLIPTIEGYMLAAAGTIAAVLGLVAATRLTEIN